LSNIALEQTSNKTANPRMDSSSRILKNENNIIVANMANNENLCAPKSAMLR
jgi:hypothetical protein